MHMTNHRIYHRRIWSFWSIQAHINIMNTLVGAQGQLTTMRSMHHPDLTERPNRTIQNSRDSLHGYRHASLNIHLVTPHNMGSCQTHWMETNLLDDMHQILHLMYLDQMTISLQIKYTQICRLRSKDMNRHKSILARRAMLLC